MVGSKEMKSLDPVSAAGARSKDSGQADALIEVAKAAVPRLRARTEEASELRRLPDTTIEEMHEAGLWRILTPRKFGGFQGTPRQLSAVLNMLATGCGSTSWVYGIYLLGPYFLSILSDAAQEEFFSVEGARSCQSFNPTGQAVACPGGYRLSGTWRFCTGQHHAHFAVLATHVIGKNDVPMGPAQVLVPCSELKRLDDWDVSGLRGTGSNSMTAEGLFVPAHRVTMNSDIMAGTAVSTLRAEEPAYQMPLIPLFAALSTGTPIGLATAALEILAGRIHKRGITYTQYTKQSEATVTHLQMAEAQMKFDQACFHADRGIRTVEAMAGEGNVLDRVRCRADTAWALNLSREVVSIAQNASGASSISLRDPLRRMVLDIEALSLHSYLILSTNAELYGRVLCGLEPGTPFV